MKYFYSHIIQIESLIIELEKLDLSEKEKDHLAKLIDSSLHHKVLDVVLSELKEKDKEEFMKHLHKGDNARLWELLNSRVDKIEEKISQAVEDLKIKMHKDIKDAKDKE